MRKIDDELTKAGAIESEAIGQRKEAVAKIYAFWVEKRVQIKEKREIQRAKNQYEKELAAAEEKSRQESEVVQPVSKQILQVSSQDHNLTM